VLARPGRISIVWLVLAACGGGGPQPRATPAPVAPSPTPGDPAGGDASCQQAIDAMFAVTAAKEPPELRDRSARAFLRRCEADRWSVELRQCMAAVKAPEDADACEQMLTPAQGQALRDELAKELDAAGVGPETQSGRPKAMEKEEKKMKKEDVKKSKAPAKAPGGANDPCEGGE
jgi:hypothetical protein